MKNLLIGRKEEQAILLKAIQSDEPEMIAVLGRRRIGKTYLIRSVYKDRIRFEISGLQNANLKKQLQSSRVNAVAEVLLFAICTFAIMVTAQTWFVHDVLNVP